jgi:tetratricopeptide (TPR) repeat protein
MKSSLLLLPLLFLAAPGASQERDDSPVIVVTGKSLAETERALAECLARRCPPNEDIDATLAHAENLFVAGEYKKARATTLASLGRNRKHARQYPVDVSDLFRANGRIAAHLGEAEDYERSTASIKRALKAGLPKDDIRLVGAELETAGMYASIGRLDRARQIYEGVQHDARRLGRSDLAALAKVRAAWLHKLAGDPRLARQALREIVKDDDPAARVSRVTAMILLARLDRQEGKQASPEALIAELRGLRSQKPVLLFQPQIPTSTRITGEGEGGSVTRLMATDHFEDQWIDVGFWVNPEGQVSEVEVLRSSGSTHWTKPLLRAIAGRIYSPAGEPPGSYRVERYTHTSHWSDVSGSRLRVRSPDARIEMLDLTAEPESKGR